ncbi:RNA-directed DNA polymerase, eukaryota, reverse transcriptase zinc-binding domain protein [Tanacetum coccineum]
MLGMMKKNFSLKKAKIDWLSERDKNSKFFHYVLKGRAHRSKIETVNDENGIRHDGAQVAEQFVKHFQIFLGKAVAVEDFELGSLKSKTVSEEDAEIMIMNVSDMEIKEALFDICDNKAPGPNGNSAKFFKSAWNVIKKDVCDAIKEFFRSGKLLGEVNATLITLVPKSKTPQKMSDYRPIAYCNTLYMIISKILTNRIKSALFKLVSPCQSAFIPERQITDNILLTQELLRGYNWKKGARRVALKINIQRAYDTTAAFTISINSDRACEDLKFKYHWGCKELQISHLSFANDLLMLCHGDLNSVKAVKRALDMFSSISGLNPNIGKSIVFFGNVKEQDNIDILATLQFKIGSLHVSYLGVPLITKHLTFTDCKGLIDKVKIKMQVYWASMFILPKSVIKDINKLLKGFLWCQGNLSKGKAKVAWKQVCKPKDEGGLGIKDLSTWNEVLMAKHLWNVASRKESLWVKWINKVRLKGCSIWEVETDVNSSHGWKQILSLRVKMRKHVFCKLRDGSSIFLWHDRWWGPEPLIKTIPLAVINQAGLDPRSTIKDMTSNGQWKWPNE